MLNLSNALAIHPTRPPRHLYSVHPCTASGSRHAAVSPMVIALMSVNRLAHFKGGRSLCSWSYLAVFGCVHIEDHNRKDLVGTVKLNYISPTAERVQVKMSANILKSPLCKLVAVLRVLSRVSKCSKDQCTWCIPSSILANRYEMPPRPCPFQHCNLGMASATHRFMQQSSESVVEGFSIIIMHIGVW